MGTQCGINQYGINISNVLRQSSHYNFIYQECNNKEDLNDAVRQHEPKAIIYNYYPHTMPWLNPQVTKLYSFPQLGIMHEVTQDAADSATNELFDFHLCPDPTLVENNPIIFKIKREKKL